MKKLIFIFLLFSLNSFGQSATSLPQIYAFVSSNTTTTLQTLQDVQGLSLPLQANATYGIEVVLTAMTSGATGTGYGINFTGTGTINAYITGTLTSNTDKTAMVNIFNTAVSPFLTASTQTGGILIKGIVVTATSGALKVQHLKVMSGTGTVFANSYLKVIRIK